jgi:hypothetical protein
VFLLLEARLRVLGSFAVNRSLGCFKQCDRKIIAMRDFYLARSQESFQLPTGSKSVIIFLRQEDPYEASATALGILECIQ